MGDTKNSGFIKMDENLENVKEVRVSDIEKQIEIFLKEYDVLEDITTECSADGDAISKAVYESEKRQIQRLIKILNILK